jgi:Tfp pilus assembly protein PilN
MDPLTASIYALLIVSVCVTLLLFNRQLSKSNEREMELKREIVELKAMIHDMDGAEDGVLADGGTERGLERERR